MTLDRNSKDAYGGENKCPYTYDYGNEEQKRLSTCGFIRFISIFSTIAAWLMVSTGLSALVTQPNTALPPQLAFTAYKIYSSSFAYAPLYPGIQ